MGNKGHVLDQAEEGERLFISQVATVASALKPARSVLDLGCGYGRASRSFTENGYAYLGVDVSPDAIDLSQADESAC